LRSGEIKFDSQKEVEEKKEKIPQNYLDSQSVNKSLAHHDAKVWYPT